MPNGFAQCLQFLPAARRYRVLVLAGPDVRRAFPLARLGVGQLTLSTWLRFARAMGVRPAHRKMATPKNGLLAVEDRRGLIQALCSFAVRPDLIVGWRLEIDNFVAADLFGGGEPAAFLVRAIEALAQAHACKDLAIYPSPSAVRIAPLMSGRPGTRYIRSSVRGK